MDTKAPLIDEVNHYTGGTRQRCSICKKIAYPNNVVATTIAAKINERIRAGNGKGFPDFFAYFKKRCGWWHIACHPIGKIYSENL